jgi:hypothetical protein
LLPASRRAASLGRNFIATKITCGAAAVFQVICGNPHVIHKEMWFLPSDAFLTECNPEKIVRTLIYMIKMINNEKTKNKNIPQG